MPRYMNNAGKTCFIVEEDGVRCDRPAVARGMCSKHHMRWYLHGDPHVNMKRGRKALYTTEDAKRMVILRHQGLTLKEIGEQYGMSKQRVFQILKKFEKEVSEGIG